MQSPYVGLQHRPQAFVQRTHRFVEQKQRGLGNQRAGESDALALSAAQGVDPAAIFARQVKQRQRGFCLGAAFGPGHAANTKAILGIAASGQMRKQRVMLEYGGDRATMRRHAAHVRATDAKLGGLVWRFEARQDAQQRGLSRAGRP